MSLTILTIVLPATSGEASIASFASIIGVPVGIASASFSFVFSITTRIILQTTQNKKKKHNKIVMLARSKLNSIEMVSQASIDSEISQEEYTTNIKEQQKYRRLKENTRMIKSQRSDEEVIDQRR